MNAKKTEQPDVDAVISALTDFQRRTVAHVQGAYWRKDDPAQRFLVADEVGLGKTLVARGVIARTIEQLWDTEDRIDVVYICSNGQIARQNLPKLRRGLDVDGAETHHADRLTMLAAEMSHLDGRKLNFVSFTPGTSFKIQESGGRAEERVMLFWLLRSLFGGVRVRRDGPWLRFLRGSSSEKSFLRQIDEYPRARITDELVASFGRALKQPHADHASLESALFECVEDFREVGRRDLHWKVSRRRYRLIGAMRKALAAAAIERLEPDLVILDEFQRFKDLMSDQGEGSDLARALFDHPSAKLLLLSATPFKMYTLPDEPEGDDHYRDFIDTVTFLAGSDRARQVERELSNLRTALLAGDLEHATKARDVVQEELRRVMVRTERLARTPDRDGLVEHRELPAVELRPDDVRDFRRLARVSKVVGAQDPLEFWRAAPYVLELMEKYKVKDKLLKHDPHDAALLESLRDGGIGGQRLEWSTIQQLGELGAANAKMRGLVADVLDRGAWQLAWIPPSLPYYELRGAYADPGLRDFTKRLIFSSWAVAPKAISTVLSYEAERRLSAVAQQSSTLSSLRQYDATRPTGRLAFQRSDGRLTGMPVLGMLYPSVALAKAGDPLDVAQDLSASLPLSVEQLEAEVRRRVGGLLATLPPGPQDGAEDEAWYWAAGLLLDVAEDAGFVGDLSFGFEAPDADGTEESRFAEHLLHAAELSHEDLGRRPADLADVLTLVALSGPGPVALRALSRVSGGAEAMLDFDVRNSASCVAWSLRNFFNAPDVMNIVKAADRGKYWLEVLRHAFNGGLQSVLDEFVFVLSADAGSRDRGTRAYQIAYAFERASSLRTSTHEFTDIQVNRDAVTTTPHRLRSHFAVRFGRGTTEDEKTIVREGQVRDAFNSPFWPFVLASTSVGQEGLDFHHYSHAIVHWNLPANPVDLEQREGRVHRYRGHAIRRNVAAVHGSDPAVVSAVDPWDELFRLAAAARPEGMDDLYPSWIPPLADGGARIQRYVATLPLSKERHALERLLRTAGAYRMVLGQPRQADLLKYLGERDIDVSGVAINLEPDGA